MITPVRGSFRCGRTRNASIPSPRPPIPAVCCTRRSPTLETLSGRTTAGYRCGHPATPWDERRMSVGLLDNAGSMRACIGPPRRSSLAPRLGSESRERLLPVATGGFRQGSDERDNAPLSPRVTGTSGSARDIPRLTLRGEAVDDHVQHELEAFVLVRRDAGERAGEPDEVREQVGRQRFEVAAELADEAQHLVEPDSALEQAVLERRGTDEKADEIDRVGNDLIRKIGAPEDGEHRLRRAERIRAGGNTPERRAPDVPVRDEGRMHSPDHILDLFLPGPFVGQVGE